MIADGRSRALDRVKPARIAIRCAIQLSKED
jgi:hypothetical protein